MRRLKGPIVVEREYASEAEEYVDAATIVWGRRELPESTGPLRVRVAPVVFAAEQA